MKTNSIQSKNILFYDGTCALCNRSVQFVLRHEKNTDLFFCALQSNYAQNALRNSVYNFSEMSTMVLLKNDKVYVKSGAALELCAFFKQPFSWLKLLAVFPERWRNGVYDWVSKNRKRFLKKDFCYIPGPENKNRFL